MQEQEYDSKEIQEWCEKFNKTQEEYYEARKMVWNMFAGLGGRKIN